MRGENESSKEVVAVQAQEVFQFMGLTSQSEIQLRQRLQEQIIVAALAQTMPHDWIAFGNEPYLEGNGAERIARFCGLSFGEYTVSTEIKPNGHIYVEVVGKVKAGEREIIEMGDCSSDDAFFQRKDSSGEKQPQDPAVVNKADVKKKAIQNWKTRSVTTFLGIRGLQWADLERLSNGRITQAKGGANVNFKRGAQGGSQQTSEQRSQKTASENSALESYQNSLAMIEAALTMCLSFDKTEEEFVAAVSEHNGKRYANLGELKAACASAFEKFKNCKLISAIAAKAKKYADDLKAEMEGA